MIIVEDSAIARQDDEVSVGVSTPDAIPAFVWSASSDGYIDFLNESGRAYTGLSPDRITGSTRKGVTWSNANLLHPDDLQGVSAIWAAIQISGRVGEMETRIRRFDGEYRWFLFRVVPLCTGSGQLLAGWGVAVDIDKRKRSEKDLRRGHTYLAEAQKLNRTGTFGWKPASTELAWSDEIFSILEYDRTVTPTLALVFARVHPEDRARVATIIDDAARHPGELNFEHRLLTPDGSVRFLHVIAHPVGDAAGELEFVAATSDITARRLAEKNVRRSETDLRQVVDLIPQMIWVAEPDGVPVSANKGALDYTGLSVEQISQLGSRFQPLIHPDDVAKLWDLRQASLMRGKPFQLEHRVVGKDGGYRWFLFHYNSLKAENGAVLRWYITGTDIDERKQAEDKLRTEERALREIIDASPSIIQVLDAAGEPVGANQVLLDYAGLQPDDFSQTGFDRQRPLSHPDDVARWSVHRRACLAAGKPFQLELRLRRKDGQYRWFLIHYGPFRDVSGRIVRWYATGLDIDERRKAAEKVTNENVVLREEIDRDSMFEEIVGSSKPLRAVLRQVAQVAPTDCTVLILGETGTGKELIARALHKRSKRAERAFVRVNCAALPGELIPSELFGHEKGAFTGALQQRLGRFELADGGTIFLDEIGDLPLETQIALLRVLQEREFERVGGKTSISVNVRVLAATNRDLKAAVADGSFRQDLFYRLNVFPIHMPSLRERADDIPLLVEYLISRYAHKAGKKIDRIDKNTLDLLRCYEWPGNIRELQNIVERAVILSETGTLSFDVNWMKPPLCDNPATANSASQCVLRVSEDRQRELIEAALFATGGKVSGDAGAARRLGVPRQTLESRIASLGIDKHRYKFHQS